MSDIPKPIADLAALLEALVVRRRSLAQTAAEVRRTQSGPDDLGPTAGHAFAADVMAVQVEIEAVKRALVHEHQLANEARLPTLEQGTFDPEHPFGIELDDNPPGYGR